MPEILVPRYGDTDPFINVSINGRDHSFRAGETVEVSEEVLEVLRESHYGHDYFSGVKTIPAWAAWPGEGEPGGGGDAPSWVRAGATSDIDFATAPPRAWVNDALIAWADFDTIIGESTLIPNRAFDPAKLDSGVGYGLGNGDQGAGTFIGAMIAAFNFNFSVVLEFADNLQLEYTEETFGTDLLITYPSSTADYPRISDANSGDALITTDYTSATPGSHKWGWSVSAASTYGAIDGVSLTFDGDAGLTAFDPTTPNQPTDIVFTAAKLKRVTVYPIKTEAELRTLTA